MDQVIGGRFNFSVNRPVFQGPIDPVLYANMHFNPLGFNGSWQRFYDTSTSSVSKPNIRQQVKCKLKELIRPGQVIQVCGGPLVGKSSLVKEVLRELHCQPEGHTIIQHHMMCKGFSSYLSLLTQLYEKLDIKESPDKFTPVHQIRAALGQWLMKHHVFVFHKCEALKDSHELYNVLDFLADLSQMGNVTVIFTSYKLFPQQSNMCNLEVGMLDDAKDLQTLLSFYTNGNHSTRILGYVSLMLRCNLCFPVAIRYFAQVYLQGSNAPSPEEVEDSIKGNSLNFLEGCLGGHLSEVENWLHIDKLKWIVLLCPNVDVSCSADHLWSMTEETGWNEIQAHLRENFALSVEPGLKRLRFHPLLLLYFMKALESRRLVLKGEWFDQSCNRTVKFLCRVLDKTEIVSRCHGNKFALFTCLLPEWCHIKNAIQMAVHRSDYTAYWKVAISGSSLLVKWSSEEAMDFYQAMYDSSSQNGFHTPKETAILEGYLAYAIAQGRDCSWKRARQHFHAALKVLMMEDCSFFTAQVMCNFARGLTRQGKYDKALSYFQQSQVMLMRSLNREREDQFCVSGWQREELAMTINIFKLIPKIFQGDNMKALTELHRIMEVMEENNRYHFEYSTALNLMGLAVQRGNGNLDRSIFYYKQSLEERMHLINVCPQDLVVPYNNLAMLLFSRGETDKALQNLFNALAIRRRYGWKNYYTALTLTHLGDIHIKLERFDIAFNFYHQADDILRETSKNHDMRLRLNLALGHAVISMDTMEMSSTSATTETCSYPSPRLSCVLSSEPNESSSSSSGNGNSRRGVDEEMSSHICSSDCIANLENSLLSKKSANYYFWLVDDLAKQSKGTLSDHGHSQLIGSLEHSILLDWHNPTMMARYIQRIRDIRTTYPWMIRELQKPEEERNTYIIGHDKFYRYISGTDPHDLDVKIVINYNLHNCDFCKYRGKHYAEISWENIISFYCKKREKCASQLRPETVCSESCDSYVSTCDPSLNLSRDGFMERNSPDIYMRVGLSSSSDPDVENGNIDSCCNDMHLTTRKHVKVTEQDCSSSRSGSMHDEPNSVISPSSEECRVSCGSNEDNLLCAGTEHALDNHHRSIEEASWNASASCTFVGEVNREQQIYSVESYPNIPFLSMMCTSALENESHPLSELESQTRLNNNNNNTKHPCCLTSVELQQILFQAYRKQMQEANENFCVETGNENVCVETGNENVCVETGKMIKLKRGPRPESGFVSDGDSIVNGNGTSEHLNLTKFSSNGRCSALRHDTEGDFGGRTSDIVVGVHESNGRHATLPLVFPVENCRGPANAFPQNGWLRESRLLNGNFCVNNGNAEAPVDSCFVGNNNLANFNTNVSNDVAERLSQLTMSDSMYSSPVRQVNTSQGLIQHNPIPSAKQRKRSPSEQDERDVN